MKDLLTADAGRFSIFYVGFGIMLTLHIFDILIRWYTSLFNKSFKNEIEHTIVEIYKIVAKLEARQVDVAKAQEQIDDLFEWHAPNSSGQQIWKSQTEVNRLRDKIDALSDDSKQSFRDVLKIISE